MDADTKKQEFSRLYEEKLDTLVVNKESIFEELTKLALNNQDYAEQIVNSIKERIERKPNHVLLAMYLIDSICKSIGNPYTAYFAKHIYQLFKTSFLVSKDSVRQSLKNLFNYWKTDSLTPTNQKYFPKLVMNKIDNFLIHVHNISKPQPKVDAAAATAPTTVVATIDTPIQQTPQPQQEPAFEGQDLLPDTITPKMLILEGRDLLQYVLRVDKLNVKDMKYLSKTGKEFLDGNSKIRNEIVSQINQFINDIKLDSLSDESLQEIKTNFEDFEELLDAIEDNEEFNIPINKSSKLSQSVLRFHNGFLKVRSVLDSQYYQIQRFVDNTNNKIDSIKAKEARQKKRRDLMDKKNAYYARERVCLNYMPNQFYFKNITSKITKTDFVYHMIKNFGKEVIYTESKVKQEFPYEELYNNLIPSSPAEPTNNEAIQSLSESLGFGNISTDAFLSRYTKEEEEQNKKNDLAAIDSTDFGPSLLLDNNNDNDNDNDKKEGTEPELFGRNDDFSLASLDFGTSLLADDRHSNKENIIEDASGSINLPARQIERMPEAPVRSSSNSPLEPSFDSNIPDYDRTNELHNGEEVITSKQEQLAGKVAPFVLTQKDSSIQPSHKIQQQTQADVARFPALGEQKDKTPTIPDVPVVDARQVSQGLKYFPLSSEDAEAEEEEDDDDDVILVSFCNLRNRPPTPPLKHVKEEPRDDLLIDGDRDTDSVAPFNQHQPQEVQETHKIQLDDSQQQHQLKYPDSEPVLLEVQVSEPPSPPPPPPTPPVEEPAQVQFQSVAVVVPVAEPRPSQNQTISRTSGDDLSVPVTNNEEPQKQLRIEEGNRVKAPVKRIFDSIATDTANKGEERHNVSSLKRSRFDGGANTNKSSEAAYSNLRGRSSHAPTSTLARAYNTNTASPLSISGVSSASTSHSSSSGQTQHPRIASSDNSSRRSSDGHVPKKSSLKQVHQSVGRVVKRVRFVDQI